MGENEGLQVRRCPPGLTGFFGFGLESFLAGEIPRPPEMSLGNFEQIRGFADVAHFSGFRITTIEYLAGFRERGLTPIDLDL